MIDRLIVPRAVIGVPDPGSRARLAGSIRHLLVHHPGAPGYNDSTKDLAYAKSVARYGISARKTWEYNYLIGPGGTIFEQAGDRVAAHCRNFNPDSYGVLLMLGDDVQPTAAMIDSFRWLRSHLISIGALHLASDAVPHYRYRRTACPGSTLADAPHGTWTSPTGEGSLGDLHAPLLMPWTDPAPVGAPTPAPPPTQTPIPEDDMSQSDTIVCNKDQFYDALPTKAKFLLLASGKLRLLSYLEWKTRGSDEGTPWANDAIGHAGVTV